MPRLLLGADAWLPDASTVCQVEELTPGSCVAELNLQSTAGNAASLQAAGSDSNPGKCARQECIVVGKTMAMFII